MHIAYHVTNREPNNNYKKYSKIREIYAVHDIVLLDLVPDKVDTKSLYCVHKDPHCLVQIQSDKWCELTEHHTCKQARVKQHEQLSCDRQHSTQWLQFCYNYVSNLTLFTLD